MFQFYFQIIYLFYFIICQSPRLSGGGETHYKMCRRRERERESASISEGGRAARRWVGFRAFFSPYSLSKAWAVYLRGKCFIIRCLWNRWLIVLPFFSPSSSTQLMSIHLPQLHFLPILASLQPQVFPNSLFLGLDLRLAVVFGGWGSSKWEEDVCCHTLSRCTVVLAVAYDVALQIHDKRVF